MPTVADAAYRPELVFALVGAAGARLTDLSRELRLGLEDCGYEVVDIRLSGLLVNFNGWTTQDGTSEFNRIRHLQNVGNAFRTSLADRAALALAGIAAIREKRARISGSPDIPASARAYVLHQLKHPDEVDLLRQVYGSSFLLVAGHAPRAIRRTELSEKMARKDGQPDQSGRFEGDAIKVIEIDEKQENTYGQNTRDTYPKADFFANLGITSGEHEVRRFVDLLFGHPFRTPSPDEYAMYQASAVSLRSSDDNRQVGAVIVKLTRDLADRITNADVIAVGMNEVPRGGGGFYWDQDSPDYRDQALLERNVDRATEIKISALAELIEKMRQRDWLDEAHEEIAGKRATELAHVLLPDVSRTRFMEIGEFSRPVHAEMAALIDGARRGVAVDRYSMYVTTFPCHNCAKHIIAAGLRRVVYLEPYPKSRANMLHGEEIVQESIDGKEKDGQVVFCAFSGVAPRQYRQLFGMSERGAKKGKSLGNWKIAKRSLSPKYVIQNASQAYLANERQELEKLRLELYRWDKNTLCPKVELGNVAGYTNPQDGSEA
jgi:deoxycytidylate deaminase